MRKFLFVFSILACTFVLAQGQAPEKFAKVCAGDPVPSFTVSMTDGSRCSIDDLRGKVVLITFWATWCPPCRAEMSHVQEDIINRFANEEFVFLPISRGEESETVMNFRKKTGYDFPMGLDPDREIYSLFAEKYIPLNFVVDPQGKITTCEVGYDPESFEKVLTQIDEILKQNKKNRK